MNFFLKIFKAIPGNVKLIIAAVLAIVIAILYYNWKIQSLETKLAIAQQNIAAFTDTIRIERNKVDEEESVKLVLESQKENLQKACMDLNQELDKEKGKVKYIEKVLIQYKIDTLRLQNTVSGDTIKWHYDHSDSGGDRHLSGQSTPSQTLITRDEWSLNIVTGLRERSDKKMEIFIRAKNPNISFGKIDGAVLDATKPIVPLPAQHWSIGPCASVIVDPTGTVRYGVGASIQWSWWRF